jgi:hypothetical protein
MRRLFVLVGRLSRVVTERNEALPVRLSLEGENEMNPKRRVAIALTIILASTAAAAQPLRWERFVVPETGTSVDIPRSIFTTDAGQPQTGYGQRFLSSDRQANLTVQSVPNEAGDSPAAFLAKRKPPSGIEYKRVTSRFFAVSSFRNDKIWYDRCNFAGRFINCVLINYPAAEKREWDEVVTRISNTLSGK